MDQLKICRVIFPRVISRLDNFYTVSIGNGWEIRHTQEKKANKKAVEINKEINTIFFSVNSNLAQLVALWKTQMFVSFKANSKISEHVINCEAAITKTQKNHSSAHFQTHALFFAASEILKICKLMLNSFPAISIATKQITQQAENDVLALIDLGKEEAEGEPYFSEFGSLSYE